MEPRLAVNNDQGPGPPFPPNDWITSIPVGTRFLCRDSKTRIILELEVLARAHKFVKLIDHADDSVCWHDPLWFCHQKEYLVLLE